MQGNGCPIVRNILSDFNTIVEEYNDKSFKFFMINSNTQDSRNLIKKESGDFKFQVPVLSDQNQLIADILDITITSEVLILHPTTREILYRGPVNNRLDYGSQVSHPTETYLRDALEAILIDNVPVSKLNKTRGCKVTRRSSLEKDTLSYTKDIALILKDQCIRCHTEGGVAPWAMTDYNTVKGWSAMIEQVLISQRMPPWKADPEIGSFKNSFALSDQKRRKIIRWIRDGMQYGEGKDPLTILDKNAIKTSFNNRVPDTIITLKKEIIPATGILEYRHQKINLDLPEGKWLSGVSLVPGKPQVTHHVTLASSNKPKLVVDRPERPWIDNLIAVVASGTSKTTLFPENSGIYLDPDTELIVQTHYTTIGVEEEDTSQIELYYSNEKPEKEFFSLGVFTADFEIEAYKKFTPAFASDTLNQDINVHSVFPHMHFRGKQMKITATLPDKSVIDIISVPDFDFNWQLVYYLEQPLFLPKGTIISAKGHFDNSYQNPLNVDPTKEVTFGYQSSDEMFMGLINYTLSDKIIVKDSL